MIGVAVIPALFFYKSKGRGSQPSPSCRIDGGSKQMGRTPRSANGEGQRALAPPLSGRSDYNGIDAETPSEGTVNDDQLDLGASFDAGLPVLSPHDRAWPSATWRPAPR